MLFPLAFNLGPWEIGLIALLALLLFGGKKLPSLAKDLGSGIKEFRKSLFSSGEDSQPVLPEKEPQATAKTAKQKKS
ncbi:MAG: twin-arginine translocase TatA/TatE family subunit [Leptospiraceae bacterium]|nr:twin-arginine translocase TatA/TatE family subunit [Leptospiraceae bacterium]